MTPSDIAGMELHMIAIEDRNKLFLSSTSFNIL